MDGVIKGGNAAGILGALPNFDRCTLILERPGATVAELQYLIRAYIYREFFYLIFRSSL